MRISFGDWLVQVMNSLWAIVLPCARVRGYIQHFDRQWPSSVAQVSFHKMGAHPESVIASYVVTLLNVWSLSESVALGFNRFWLKQTASTLLLPLIMCMEMQIYVFK
jgi:hypothetical protein